MPTPHEPKPLRPYLAELAERRRRHELGHRNRRAEEALARQVPADIRPRSLTHVKPYSR